MEYKNTFEINEYLHRFDEILCEMSNRMLSFNTTSNITINFIECMIPHHEAAIYMSENLLTYTNYKPLYDIAKGIIKMQTTGIAQMREIVRTTQTRWNTQRDVSSYEEKYLEITKNMISKMKNSPRTSNINYNFTVEMIPHHEGAVEMCNNLLRFPIDQRLRIVANNIIREQSRGIIELKQIQRNL